MMWFVFQYFENENCAGLQSWAILVNVTLRVPSQKIKTVGVINFFMGIAQ